MEATRWWLVAELVTACAVAVGAWGHSAGDSVIDRGQGCVSVSIGERECRVSGEPAAVKRFVAEWLSYSWPNWRTANNSGGVREFERAARAATASGCVHIAVTRDTCPAVRKAIRNAIEEGYLKRLECRGQIILE